MTPQLVNAKYDRGPFKLICDDFGPANMIVRSKDDLTIVGVVDLEWVYAGPAQLFASAPWWLLHDRPVNEEWDFSDGKPPDATQRYFKCLDIFKRVLAEEEAKIQSQQEVSELVNWSEASGGHVAAYAFIKRLFRPIQLPLHASAGEIWGWSVATTCPRP
jgi:hypothetical protein